MNAPQEKVNHAVQNAEGWADSIRQMVAALECDYDRLEELRDERDSFEELPEVPEDFAVKVLEDGDQAEDRATCGQCGRSWDDAIVTGMTPAPSARCPFEAYHAQTWAEANPTDAEELKGLTEAATIDGDKMADADAVRERIQESPLSVEVRGGWVAPGEEGGKPEEFCILLSTGGPALRIMGELDEHGTPTRAWLEYQDWGTQWTHHYVKDFAPTLLTFCEQFYFGE